MNAWQLLHDVGSGDFVNAESFWHPDKKAALEVMYHPTLEGPGSGSLIQAMRACPDFKHVEHRRLGYPTERPPGAVPTSRDHAISHRLRYYGSSFLKAPLDVEPTDGLPGRYFVIQPDTPKNGPGCPRWVRAEEWPHVAARLAEFGCNGLVLNAPGGKSPVPDRFPFIDRTGLTTFAQSIEVLKSAEGYIGVDSCLAILAAQLFPARRLAIRSVNPYLIDYPWLTYPPQLEYSFLYPSFDEAAWPPPAARPEAGTVVELRCNALVGTEVHGGGARVELEAGRASRMIAAGQAVPVHLSTSFDP